MPVHGYFVEAQPELTSRLDAFLAELRADLERQPGQEAVSALLLAGGYGRGEGGVFCATEEASPQLYNDLEFYLVLRDRAWQGAAEAWAARWSHKGDEELGIEVEFKVLGDSFLEGSPSMFFYDLLAAHREVYAGGEPLTPPASLLDPALIPAHEATRLLFNRGSGLFFSRTALARADARAGNGFVERNHAKVRLALGDAVLALNGRYHFSCVERERRLEESLRVPPDWAVVRHWHTEGVEFKLRPRHGHPPLPELCATQAELTAVWLRTFLWLETERLSRPFPDAAAYASTSGRLYPHTQPWRDAALHGRDRLKRGAALPGWLDYPRAALQRALVLLLQPAADLPGAAKHLGLSAGASLTEILSAYERWWKLYN